MRIKTYFAFLILLLLVGTAAAPAGYAHAAPVLKPGSSGGDVWDLQYRLTVLGYYRSELDGIYGPVTASAVRAFQRDYGLAVDGTVGVRTWTVLKKVSLNRPEIDMLARLIHAEARGEPYVGQVAVGAVVMNRIQSPKFPDTLREVVFQPGAFTAVDDGQFWLTPDKTAYRAAFDAVRGWDPTYGALYYYNPATATSDWIRTRPVTVKIGNHLFAR